MSVTFPNTASILYRQETSPWYNGFNAPGSGSDGQLTFDNMDYNWYGLNSASYQTIEVIKGAAYTGSSNTFTEPQTFTSNVGISGSLTGSMARFSGQVISDYPGVGFLGTASWAANAITSSVFVTTSSISASYASSSTSASFIYIASNNSTNIDYTLVFKNSPGALDNFYQLAADGTNGPYYNPSTNVLGGLGGLTVSASKGVFTSITGSLSGSVNGTASYAISASHALTASYASNGVTNLGVGTFYDTSTQTVVAGASASITLNTPVIQDGVIVASNSRVTVTRTGIYNLQFSAQVQTTVGGSPDIHIWLRKNGVDVSNSNTGISIQNQNQKYVGAWNFVESLIAGDYLELVWYVNGGASAQLVAEPAAPANGGVGVPSVILTMIQIK
jgi:hypothetical protein